MPTVKTLRPTKGPRWAHAQPFAKSRGHVMAYKPHGEHELTPSDPRIAERIELARIARERLSE